MKVDDVVNRLVACGLSQKEALALAHLTSIGPSKVTDLARAAGLKRAETYQVLERLQARGLVEATLARPRQFSAIDPTRAVAILVEERATQLKSIQGMQEDLEERLGRLAGGGTPREAQAETFRILHDRNQIAGQLGRTLRAAQKEVSLVASGRSLYRLLLDEGLESEFLDAHSRGVEIRILTEILPGAEALAARLATFARVAHMMVPRPLRFLIADEREIVQYVTADPLSAGSKETALWIGARDHVQAQRAFFDDLWAAAMSLGARREELETGRATEQVHVLKGRLTRYDMEKQLILRAREEVCLVLSSGDVKRLEKSGVGRALATRIAEGVRVRLILPVDAKLTVAGAQIRRGQDLPPILLVDAAEALFAFAGKNATDAVTDPGEYGVWLSLEPSVAQQQRAFENAWAQGSP